MPLTITDNQDRAVEALHIGFSGGERHVQLSLPGSIDSIDSTRFTIRALIRSSDDLMDLLLTRNALSAAFPNAAFNVEIPYLPYARQDRVCAPGQAFSLQVVAQMIGPLTSGGQLVVWDCHSHVGVELTGAHNVDASSIVLAHAGLRSEIQSEDAVLVCPDKGARARCQSMAKMLGDRPLIFCEKVRDPSTGRILRTEVGVDDLSGKTAIITDDICDGGMTFIKIAEQLKAKHADRVILFVTHGIFSKGLDVFDGLIDHIYTTNSFPQVADSRLTCIQFAYDFSTHSPEGR
jgi:ribose-phosphate pyrophosphokinase